MNETKDVQRRGTEFFVSWNHREPDSELASGELDQLVKIADVMIPGGNGWPVPSTTELRAYIREGAHRANDIALLREAITAVGSALNDGSSSIEPALIKLKAKRGVAFTVLLEFVYYAYYAQPEVARAIRDLLDCDYISPPQPHGYSMPADTDLQPARTHSYVATGDVKRVDLSGIDLAEKPVQGAKSC